MSSLTSVSASEVVIGDVADEFMPPCQRVHATTVTVYMAAGIWTGVASDTGSQANRLDHSATTHRRMYVAGPDVTAFIPLLDVQHFTVAVVDADLAGWQIMYYYATK